MQAELYSLCRQLLNIVFDSGEALSRWKNNSEEVIVMSSRYLGPCCFDFVFFFVLTPPLTLNVYLSPSLGWSSFSVQDDVCAEAASKRLFPHLSAERGKFLCLTHVRTGRIL